MLTITILTFLMRVSAARPRRDERGQTTAEYALVIVAAAVIGALLMAWAAKTGFVDKLFDVTLGRVIKSVNG
jgi:Flp pilus assembly pilin Flp